MAGNKNFNLQPYPRQENSLLAKESLLSQNPYPLSDKDLESAVDAAFSRALKNRVGNSLTVYSDPKDIVEQTLKHLRERSDPILSPYFFSACNVDEIFELDSISYEMQRQRMKVGVFYQYLIIELMKTSARSKKTNIEAVFDGTREGDVVADIRTPNFAPGIRIYGSVKKSSDTVGGQDVPGVISRLENVAKAEKNISRPYLCVLFYATPTSGRLRNYESSRNVKYDREGKPFSYNCESWEPGFVFPFVTGRSAEELYKLAIKKVGNYLPFYALENKEECSILLKKRLVELGLIGKDGKLDQEEFMKFIVRS